MLWFAFNYWYYDLWIQLSITVLPASSCCDLLSITGITIFEYNIWWKRKILVIVVICFQLLVLRSLNTTSSMFNGGAPVLWFAFNYWYYDLWIQRIVNNLSTITCCDLLSITGITIFEYNWLRWIILLLVVVICFQLLVLRSLNTTATTGILLLELLWFAFNYWYYDLWIQPARSIGASSVGCDLLSITGITIFEYNWFCICCTAWTVVICFQLLVLRSLNTTDCMQSNYLKLLWFAFNYWYYDLWIQRQHLFQYRYECCDLLSITGITIFEYNTLSGNYHQHFVVICFQLLVLRSLNTTSFPVKVRGERCDLLSITGITIFEYNILPIWWSIITVVICFQLLVLRSLNTTY